MNSHMIVKELTKKYSFSEDYRDKKCKVERLTEQLRYTSDPLRRPLLELDFENAERELALVENILVKNIDNFFKVAELLNIPRVFIGTNELVGADDIRLDGWPAIWRLKDIVSEDGKLKYAAGCGNGDQSQTTDTRYYIPDKYIDRAWNVKTREEIDRQPFERRMVVTMKTRN